jgi:hypothetical protein
VSSEFFYFSDFFFGAEYRTLHGWEEPPVQAWGLIEKEAMRSVAGLGLGLVGFVLRFRLVHLGLERVCLGLGRGSIRFDWVRIGFKLAFTRGFLRFTEKKPAKIGQFRRLLNKDRSVFSRNSSFRVKTGNLVKRITPAAALKTRIVKRKRVFVEKKVVVFGVSGVKKVGGFGKKLTRGAYLVKRIAYVGMLDA